MPANPLLDLESMRIARRMIFQVAKVMGWKVHQMRSLEINRMAEQLIAEHPVITEIAQANLFRSDLTPAIIAFIKEKLNG